MSAYRVVRTRTDYLDTDFGEVELPTTDSSECADSNHLATLLADGRLLVSYLASDDSYQSADDALGDAVTYVEHLDTDEMTQCAECGEYEESHPIDADDWDCKQFVGRQLRSLFDQGRLWPVYVFTHAAYAGMDLRDDPDDWDGASGYLLFADDLTVTDRDDGRRIAESFTTEWAAWASGEVYGIVHAFYTSNGDGWNLASDESCWGFVGVDYALTALTEEHAYWVNNTPPPVSAEVPS